MPHSIAFAQSLLIIRPHLYILQPRTVFGSGGDIKPLSLTVVKNHCVVVKEAPVEGGEGDQECYALECGQGETYHNGR